MGENDLLRQDNERLKVEGVNYEKRIKFFEGRIRQLEGVMGQKDIDYREEVRRTVEEWRDRVDKL